MSTTESAADNGVNVAHLLGARDALTDAPEGAEFTWRATNQWLRGTHSKTTIEQYSGLGADHDRDWGGPVLLIILAHMPCGVLAHADQKSGFVGAFDLHSVSPDVAIAGLRVLGDHVR